VHYTGDLAAIPPEFRDSAELLNAPQPRPIPPPVTNESVGLKVTPGAPITIEARLNGVSLTLIVDTGADRTVISPEAIERAGLGGQEGRTIQVIGVTGTSTASLVTIPLLDVAGARIGPIVVVAHALPPSFRGPEGSGGAAEYSIDGLLGRDVLDGFTLNLDTASGRATLTPR
jgi:Aspartyl protease